VSFFPHGPWGHVNTATSHNATDAEVEVEQRTLPQILELIGWETPDFIKMDVEGCELQTLTGAGDWFTKGHRPTILYEANGATLQWWQQTPKDLNARIDTLGYHRYEMTDDGGIRQPSAFEPRCLVDYIASPVPLPAQPALQTWSLVKRTIRAFQYGGPEARRYTFKLLLGMR